MSWSEVRLLYLRELRSAFREKSIVVNSVLLPVLLYPLMLWLGLTGFTFVSGLSEGFVSRIALRGVPPAHAELRDSLASMESVDLVEAPGEAEVALERIRRGELDALVEFLPASGPSSGVAENVRIRISYDGSEERSTAARTRMEDLVDRYRDRWLEEEADRLGIQARDLEQYGVTIRNVASSREMGAFVLGSMVPLFLVVMVAVGCFVPAVDCTAGERERGTWETTMTVSASRGGVVTAKYLYVATLGMLAGTLNVVAVTVSIGPIFRPFLEQAGETMAFSIPLTALPVMILGAAILAFFFAAAMMILASFARTFKDGQAMVTPVYWLALLPLLIGDSPDQHLTPGMAAIPVANVAMMIRDAIVGSFQPLLILETLGVGVVMVTVCLWVARKVLQFEDLLLGSYAGSFWRFARERLVGGGEKPA